MVDDGDDEEDDDDDDDDDDEIQIINSEPNSNVVAPKVTRNFPLANDFNALAAKLMKPIEDYPTKRNLLCLGNKGLGTTFKGRKSPITKI